MTTPNLKEEKKLWEKGFKRVAGLDEAGRGPLCGPVVAAAAILNSKIKNPYKAEPSGFRQKSKLQIKIQNLEIKDSKKLSSKKREKLYQILTHSDFIEWGIGRVSEKVVDKINILEATKLAMVRAVKNLEKKLLYNISHGRRKRSIVDFLILDGNFGVDLPLPQKSIIKGDEKVFSCAAASILAKVYRDRIMERYDKKYPRYGFSKHKGYPTKFHIKMLKRYGPCRIHRRSFRPIKGL